MKLKVSILLPFLLASCVAMESNPAAPSLNAIRRHQWLAPLHPELAPLFQAELDARAEYENSIRAGDDARFQAAKAAMAKAVQAVKTALGEQ